MLFGDGFDGGDHFAIDFFVEHAHLGGDVFDLHAAVDVEFDGELQQFFVAFDVIFAGGIEVFQFGLKGFDAIAHLFEFALGFFLFFAEVLLFVLASVVAVEDEGHIDDGHLGRDGGSGFVRGA